MQFSDEYRRAIDLANPYWRWVRRLTLAITLGRDVCLPFLRATQVDHLHYRNLGHEWPFRDVVPLNRHVHSCVTFARSIGLKFPVNLLLRASYLLWIVAWVFLVLELLHLGHVSAFDPWAFVMFHVKRWV